MEGQVLGYVSKHLLYQISVKCQDLVKQFSQSFLAKKLNC